MAEEVVKAEEVVRAEEALKKLEEQLNCSICLDTYINPKQLQCNHIYCYKCLVKLVFRDQQGQLSLTCPTCRQVTPVPANGVAGLQSAFHINHLIDIQESVRKITLPAIPEGDEQYPSLKSPLKKVRFWSVSEASYCSEHDDKELELFCETCGELICCKCAIKDGRHHDHDYESVDKAFLKFEKEITSSVEPVENQLTTVNNALSQLETRCRQISDQRAAIEASLHDNFRRLHEVLDARKAELISQLHQITQEKLKALATQRDQIETSQVQLSRCLDFIKENFKTGSRGEVMMKKLTIAKQVKELTTTFQPELLMINTEADMAFSTSVDIAAVCQNYGQIMLTSSLPDLSKCHITSKELEVATVGHKSTAVLEILNFNGKPCKEPVKSPMCKLVSEITDTRTYGSMKRSGQSQYMIIYQPNIKGKHKLCIKIDGQHIRGSPFRVAAKQPVDQIGTPIQIIRGVKEPLGVAINQKGEVVVAESNHVSVFSPSGEKLRSFGTHGSGQGQFNCPDGVAVDCEGNILVADRVNNRIQTFTEKGQFLASVGVKGNGPLQFNLPRGIAINSSNNKIYTVDENDRVQVLNSDLTFSSYFGKKGSGKGQFDAPCGITCDDTGNVYVADTWNHRIQVFTAEGKFLRMFGKRGDSKGKLKWPHGIAVDTSGIVYVSDSELGNSSVSLFTSEGVFVTSFGSGKFELPRGLAVDCSGVVYVCDHYNNRVQAF